MYIPPSGTTELTTYSNKIVGIQGPSGSGKTISSLTFPNPVIALFEKPDLAEMSKIPMLAGVKPVLLPFYDTAWLDTHKYKKFHPGTDGYSPTHDPAGAYLQFLEGEAKKLTNEQTLITDNWTRLQEKFDKINWSYKTYSKKGEEDFFEPWDRKITYSENVSNALISLNCNIVVLFHETPERDKTTGQLFTDKIQPLQQGKFIAKMKSYYPNFFRQHCRMKKDTATGKETGEREFVWQVQGNSSFDAKCSKVGLPMFVPAEYKSIA